MIGIGIPGPEQTPQSAAPASPSLDFTGTNNSGYVVVLAL